MKKTIFSLLVCLVAIPSIADSYRYFELTLEPSVIMPDSRLGLWINTGLKGSCRILEEKSACLEVQNLLARGQYSSLRGSLVFFDKSVTDILFKEFGNYRYDREKNLVRIDLIAHQKLDYYDALSATLSNYRDNAADTWMEGDISFSIETGLVKMRGEMNLSFISLRPISHKPRNTTPIH